MLEEKVVNLTVDRSAAQYIAVIEKAYVAFVSDRIGKHYLIDSAIKPLEPTDRLCGIAVTSLGTDLTVRRAAIDTMEAGDVLVVAAGGSSDWTCFGDGTAQKIVARGGIAAVIDGCTRDSPGLVRMGFPTFCRGATAKNYYYPHAIKAGGVNVPVSIGNVSINPGDIVFGDRDGVVAIPRALAPRIAELVSADLEAERTLRAGVGPGFRSNAHDELVANGYVIRG
ncbi:RraA family protein [Roseibium sp.]|uniref:RraA family protein n=1 Tax=Roseibium sp. TaxID=1936156 RepID=UPI003A97C920